MRKLRPLSWVIIAVNLLFVWWIIGGVGGAVAVSVAASEAYPVV
jgi:hypothetical protein